MRIIKSLKQWNTIRKEIAPDVSIGFVPTMGNLHAGHLSLIRQSKKQNDITVLSIYINPTQFNAKKDLTNYPRTFNEDKKCAKQSGVDYILLPEYHEIYADQYTYKISESVLSALLEGRFRPGHFDGVLTIVLKLLNLVKADKAYFGEKDYQQLSLIKGLVKAFFINTKIVGCPIVRNQFGLALSSRNNLLTDKQLEQARWFPKILLSNKSILQMKKILKQKGFEIDYIEDYDGRRFAAVKLGDVRLIDNRPLLNEEKK